VNLHERVGLDEELPTILQTIWWGKLYNEPRLGSRLLTHEFLITFETVKKNRKSFVKFRLFGKSFGCDFSRFSEHLDFSKSCLPESSAMRNFNKVEFSDAISKKSTRLRFSDIHNPGLWFFHRWMPFMLFPMAKLNSVASPELKCLFAMIKRIKYTPVADIVGYFKNVHKILGPIECTSMVTRIAMNLGCPKIDCTLVKVLHCSLIRWERCTKLHRTTSHSRASSYGGNTADHNYTTCSPSGASVGHWVWGWLVGSP
jgi:hypothetical protein